MRGETKDGHGRDEPLGRVVLEPLDGVSEIHGELMVEVVVALTDGAESSEEVITGSVLVVERLVSEPVSQRVDTEGGLEVSQNLVVERQCHLRGEQRQAWQHRQRRIHLANLPIQVQQQR